jgi:hypothetical protein
VFARISSRFRLLLLSIAVGAAAAAAFSFAPRPRPVLWAWERPEDLRFLKPGEADVAFLAQTLQIEADGSVTRVPRRQPLRVNRGTRLIAVTRIEGRPALSREGIDTATESIAQTLRLSGVAEIQLDFDATLTQRASYTSLTHALRERLAHTRLTITALSSWCMGDPWIQDLPIDGAVPMVFQMGPDDRGIRRRLSGGDDWQVPACRASYGLATYETPPALKSRRQLYLFINQPWTRASLASAMEKYD